MKLKLFFIKSTMLLGSLDARPFNEGKQEEVKRRVKHL